MKLHSIAPAEGAVRISKRVGRGIGSGRGKTSTRGHKGQGARSGGGVRPGFEGGQMPLTRTLPKRGFNNRFSKEYSILNVSDLNIFENGETVTPQVLLERRVIGKLLSSGVKVLGNGEISKSVTVKANKFTATAKEKIEKAGGKVEVL